MTWLRILLLFCLLPGFALAEEPSTYSPEFCEFSITFPGEPYKVERCDEDNAGQCYEMVSYTQVYDMIATVNFRVICNPVGEEVKNKYSGEIMESTLKAMTQGNVIQTFDTSFREEEKYKQAGLVGESKVGNIPTIYIAQLWIGGQSALSVEAELIGEAHDEADQLFSDILKSVHYIEEDKETEETVTEDETEPKNLNPNHAPPN